MKFLVTVLATSSFLYLILEASKFYEDTRCRQRAWRISTEKVTSNLLGRDLSPHSDKNCRLKIYHSLSGVTWSRGFRLHRFELPLKGKL
jgi:hypothetical protein